MTPQEIKEEVADRPIRSVALFSTGNIITLVVALVSVAFSYGILSQRVDGIEDSLGVMRGSMTPGAAAAIAGIQAVDTSQNIQIIELRSEIRESRREILIALTGFEVKLDRHMEANR